MNAISGQNKKYNNYQLLTAPPLPPLPPLPPPPLPLPLPLLLPLLLLPLGLGFTGDLLGRPVVLCEYAHAMGKCRCSSVVVVL